MKNNSHKYYLQVSGKTMDLNKIDGLKNMENFLNLSIFTSLFANEKELVKTLIALGYEIELRDNVDVVIVKRIGNRNTGYGFKEIANDIIYRDASIFLSIGAVLNFIYTNKDQVEPMTELFQEYLDSTENIIDSLKKKIEILFSRLLFDSRNDEIKSEIKSRQNSLRNFENQKANLKQIMILLKTVNSDHGYLNRTCEMEYSDRVTRFVYGEVYYFFDKHHIQNNRGLVQLALKLYDLVCRYPKLKIPVKTTCHDKSKREMLKAIKKALGNISLETFTDDTSISTSEKIYGEDSGDPDGFMFLEGEDFERGLPPEPTPEQLESVQSFITRLEQKKAKFKS